MDISAIPICRFMRVGELSLMDDGKNSEDFPKRQMETGALLTLHLCGIWPQTLYSNFLRLLESDQLISYSYGKLDSSSVSKCSKLSRGGSRELITTETDKSMIS
ncbi:hypothetical protein L596_023462 [Steinernema carpocapsae]|uniref:Uncharacterized protein n=1 Tax=Steinernema carpocapsae TaxID=34508 RepID=A0A4U5MDQ8_STECR|nr:hypothetical protein L596_023462 [Steinernema carpocapsae]